MLDFLEPKMILVEDVPCRAAAIYEAAGRGARGGYWSRRYDFSPSLAVISS
jgi:hypothetical protein